MRVKPFDFSNFIEKQDFWDDNSIVDVQVANVYKGPENIMEHYSLHNRYRWKSFYAKKQVQKGFFFKRAVTRENEKPYS